MLVYLDALIAALADRDAAEATRLLAHPLARLLPDDVRLEARGISEGSRDPLATPLRAMQLRFRTAELLRDAPVMADQVEKEMPVELTHPPIVPPQLSRRNGRPQMELPLSA